MKDVCDDGSLALPECYMIDQYHHCVLETLPSINPNVTYCYNLTSEWSGFARVMWGVKPCAYEKGTFWCAATRFGYGELRRSRCYALRLQT